MKVNLNATVPMERRGNVESIVRRHAGDADIEWLTSASVKMVLGIDPGAGASAEPADGSIFSSPRSGTRSLAAATQYLEERIWISMSASGH